MYFGFWFWPMHSHWHVILQLPAKFRSDRMIGGGVMSSNLFVFSRRHILRWRPAAILDLIWVMLDHPWSAIASLTLILQFGLDPIYSFGDTAIFIFWRFGLKLLIRQFLEGSRGIFPQIWSPIVVTPKRTILAGRHVVRATKCENRSNGLTWAHDREKK